MPDILLVICRSENKTILGEFQIGDSFYVDLESMKHVSPGIVRILKKVELKGPSEYASIVSDIEMQCDDIKMRVLEEISYDKSGAGKTTQKDGKWQTVNPEGTDELLLELVCSLKKSEN